MIWKNAEIGYWYLYEECFSTNPKTISFLWPRKVTKSWISQISRFSPLCPLKLKFRKMLKLVLGIYMKNVLVQFRRRYLIFRSRKCQKHKCRRYPRFTRLRPLKFEFRKMQKLVFRYLYEECFSTISKTISYFPVEKMSKP